MTAVVRAGPVSRSTVTDDELRAAVLGRLPAAVRIERELSVYSTSSTVEDVRVLGADGQQVRLMLKDLAREALLDGAREGKPDLVTDPGRELAAYRDLLGTAPTGSVPDCWAIVDEGPRRWLLLEKVPGVELYQVGDLGVWAQAAAAVAGVHERLTQGGGPGPPLVLQRGEQLLRWGRRAEQFAEQRGDAGLPGLRVVVQAHRHAVAVLDALPPVVLHGDLYASNVLVVRGSEPLRVCLVDWELASWGPAVLDLAALVSGGWSETERDVLAAAYREALTDVRWQPDPEDYGRALRCARLHVCVQWLGWSPDWVPPEEHAHDWRAEAVWLAAGLETGGAACAR